MTINEFSDGLRDILLASCEDDIKKIAKKNKKKTVYAYLIWANECCISFSTLYATRENYNTLVSQKMARFEERRKLYENYPKFRPKKPLPDVWFEFNPTEWDRSQTYLKKASKFMSDNDEFSNKFESICPKVIVDVLNTLRKEGNFEAECFEKDLYLGLYFPDAGKSLFKKMKSVSDKVNVTSWKKKFVKYYDYYYNGEKAL